MAFKSITDIPVHVKEKEPAQPFISVNKYTGGYLGGGLYVRRTRKRKSCGSLLVPNKTLKSADRVFVYRNLSVTP